MTTQYYFVYIFLIVKSQIGVIWLFSCLHRAFLFKPGARLVSRKRRYVCVCVCVRMHAPVCVSAPQAIKNHSLEMKPE